MHARSPEDLDIRTDIARYHVFEHGELVKEVTDIGAYWRDDLVTFALGCSFSFEEALVQAGLRLRFLERNNVAAVYQTTIDTVPAGPSRGPLMVTMRAFKPADAIRAVQITSRFPNVHGAPVHIRGARGDRRGSEQALPERRRSQSRMTSSPCSGPAGSRLSSRSECPAAAVHHARALVHADHRPAQLHPRHPVTLAGQVYSGRGAD